jgi:hypothetical protein
MTTREHHRALIEAMLAGAHDLHREAFGEALLTNHVVDDCLRFCVAANTPPLIAFQHLTAALLQQSKSLEADLRRSRQLECPNVGDHE